MLSKSLKHDFFSVGPQQKMAAYLHKKFKKYATEKEEKQDAPGREDDRNEIRHTVGSLVGSCEVRPTRQGGSKPLHRQYYCDICRIAFRVQSNLEKHIQTR